MNRGPGTARPQPDTAKLARRTYYDRALKASKALTIAAAARAIVLSDIVVRTWGRGLQPVSAGPGGALSLPVSWLPQGNSITSPKRMNVTHAPSCVKNGHFRFFRMLRRRRTPAGVAAGWHSATPLGCTSSSPCIIASKEHTVIRSTTT